MKADTTSQSVVGDDDHDDACLRVASIASISTGLTRWPWKPAFTGLTLRVTVTLDVSPDGTRVVFAGQLRTTTIEPATRRQ